MTKDNTQAERLPLPGGWYIAYCETDEEDDCGYWFYDKIDNARFLACHNEYSARDIAAAMNAPVAGDTGLREALIAIGEALEKMVDVLCNAPAHTARNKAIDLLNETREMKTLALTQTPAQERLSVVRGDVVTNK